MASTSDVEIELRVNDSRTSEIEAIPTTKRHERAFGGKYRMTFSSKRDEWVVKGKKRGRLSTKISDSYQSILSSTYTSYISSSIRYVMNFFPDYWNYTHLYLIILGITVAIIGSAMDLLTIELSKIHSKIPTQIIWGSLTQSDPSLITLQFIVWLFYSIILVFAAIFVTQKISSSAAGSGLPELKSILSGVYLSEYLSFKTLVAKIIGLCLSAGAGISIGKEGPLVHASAIIANQMSRWVLFERIRNSPSLLQQMLGASCAAGISANLGSPIGGVLFSIEVTSTYFPVRNYWFSFLTSVCGAITYRWIYNKRFGTPWLAALAPTYFTRLEFSFEELFAFFLLGLTCGGFGILFIKMNLYAKRWWVKYTNGRLLKSYNFYLFALIIIIVTNVLTFPKFIGEFMSLDATAQLQDMVFNGELTDSLTKGDDWFKYNMYGSLVAAFLVRYVLTAVSIVIPVPCGIFVPLLAAGSMVGRIFGEVLKDIVADDPSYVIVPGTYAVVGAASLLGAITHSLSTAVVLFEITGQIHLLLPMLISVVTSYWVMKKFSTLSLYDSLSREKKLPYLPDLIDGTVEPTAKDIMDPKVVVLSEDLKQEDISEALEASEYKNFPVVLNKESMILIGIIERRILESYVFRVSTMEQEDARTLYSEKEGLPGLPGTELRSGLVITSIPIQVSEDTPLSQIHMLFINLRLFQAYVTKNGKLLGIIKRRKLREVLDEANCVFTYLKE